MWRDISFFQSFLVFCSLKRCPLQFNKYLHQLRSRPVHNLEIVFPHFFTKCINISIVIWTLYISSYIYIYLSICIYRYIFSQLRKNVPNIQEGDCYNLTSDTRRVTLKGVKSRRQMRSHRGPISESNRFTILECSIRTYTWGGHSLHTWLEMTGEEWLHFIINPAHPDPEESSPRTPLRWYR